MKNPMCCQNLEGQHNVDGVKLGRNKRDLTTGWLLVQRTRQSRFSLVPAKNVPSRCRPFIGPLLTARVRPMHGANQPFCLRLQLTS
jgi:hypothetical protein